MKDFWDNRYAEEEYVYGILPNEFLKEELAKLNPGRILFVCEGEGRNAVYAAKQNWNVYAFDFSEEGYKKSQGLAHKNRVTLNYEVEDAVTIEYPVNSFDVIALIYAHFASEVREQIHQKILNWLKPGGHLILEAFNTNQLKNTSGGPKDISMLYTKDVLLNDFKELNFQYFSTNVIQLNEGNYHKGKADVIQLSAEKTKNIY